ncbi:MAG: helix-hairpin-helix domain-containing protein, partial [Bacteroidota bacterium]
MQNKALAQVFQLTHQLMELHGENKFKSRSYGNAAFRIGRMERQLAEVPYDGLEAVDGIGKSLAGKIVELLETGELAFLNEMLAKTPAGVVDMLSIKGIGPKKIGVIWRELGVESLGELLYACHENRLVDLKGFGAKTQELVRQNIEFRISNAGKFHYATVEPVAEALVQRIKAELNLELVAATGAVRRQCEVVDGLNILVGDPAYDPGSDADWGLELPIGVNILTCTPANFVAELFRTSAHPDHLARLQPETLAEAVDEATIYRNNGLPYIVPEMREGGMEFDWAAENAPEDLVQTTDLKGILHNHSTWSDGRHSLTEMAEYCRELGFEYLGICDHSRSAFYANGLDAERVAAQHEEIEALNARLAPFRVFKGIESDILNDGSLDYEPSVLASFDFIVA